MGLLYHLQVIKVDTLCKKFMNVILVSISNEPVIKSDTLCYLFYWFFFLDYLVVGQLLNQTLCVGYFTELVLLSVVNGPVTKSDILC